jgi:aminopeptidase N
MSQQSPQAKYLKDYLPPAFLIETVELEFHLGEESSEVSARFTLKRNPAPGAETGPLILMGIELELMSIAIDGRTLAPDEYLLGEETLTLLNAPAAFTLDIETRIRPDKNTSLEGLYKSGGNFCTQCEAEGFRKITYFLDRPDVMARYSVRIEAEKKLYPVLLSNGNLVDSGAAGSGRHFAVWEDPFPKPSYLFALVAGDLVHLENQFTTRSGREVTLRIYVREPDLDKTEHAMRSLIKSMKWDEEVYGLEYDLDVFNIVAVSDFNMGAMENKSLNIFNSKYVLAKPETATDADYVNVEGVIAHEYFHNWTGNRVTLSSWFHLSLKEGLTVFRDQCFTGDVNSAAVERIQSVAILRAAQFPEDAGPMAHPIRPPSYIEMNNFYTSTVYEKGAEVIRMIYTLLGKERFRRGMDLYFERHDGQAVTTDDFVAAMEDASGVDLVQFRLWYDQAGTPTLTVESEYDPAEKSYTLTVEQSLPELQGGAKKKPMHIPFAVGLLDAAGKEIPMRFDGEEEPRGRHCVLDVKSERQTFRFVDVPCPPVPSLLRGFSAPVYLKTDLSYEELSFLMANDADSFNRWEAGQQLATDLLIGLVEDQHAGRPLTLSPVLADAIRSVLEDRGLDPELAALTLILPGERTLAERFDIIDPDAIYNARNFLNGALCDELRELFLKVYRENQLPGEYRIDAEAIGKRRLKNIALYYLMAGENADAVPMALEQYETANNMTDSATALSALSRRDCPERDVALANFYGRWHSDDLVLDKWFTTQALSPLPNTLAEVGQLSKHESFDIKNPNKVRALLSAFAHNNAVRFHAKDGAAYRFIADRVLELNTINPQVAAKLVSAFNAWRKYDQERQHLMEAELERIVGSDRLSRNVYEIAAKALGRVETKA